MYITHDELINTIEVLPRYNMTVVDLGEIPREFSFQFLIFSRNNTDLTPD